MVTTSDREIREKLLRKELAGHVANPDTLVVEEFALDRGACRVDIAVVNGHLHGYEIKSDRDTLSRLPKQVEVYGAVLDRATLVVGERHLTKAIPVLPEWWGVRVVTIGARGAVNIRPERGGMMNPEICLASVAKLLWVSEIVPLLAKYGVSGKLLRGSRAELAKIAESAVPSAELRSYVRGCLKSRTDWLKS